MSHPAGSSESLSLWIDTSPATDYPDLRGVEEADVAIVGAGITGITAAWLLAKAGRSVVLVERGLIAMSETGHTTAHIVEATDADYEKLIGDHGEEGARADTEAIRSSIALILSLVAELGIDCGLEAKNGYLYAEEEKDREYLERQQKSLRLAGIETEWVSEVPLPFKTAGGLLYRNQYAFHPRAYLLAVAEAASKSGVRIFENSQVVGVESAGKDGWCRAETARGSIRARHVLLTTHVPLNDRGVLWAKMFTTRTYAVAATIDPDRIPDALYWDTADPYHYTRLFHDGSKTFLIVGGEDRDVGKSGNDEERYGALEEYCRSRFGVTSFTHRWSGQINEPADMLPFIGESSHGKNVWMSTGYSGTGMTYGTLAAILLTDLALERENRFAKLYDPGRTKIGSTLKNMVTKVTEFPKRMIEKVAHLDVEAKSFVEVADGEGLIVSVEGTKYAAVRLEGELRLVDPACTHMGCTVAWNGAERSWDCPCHGSRFDTRGEVLNGPATKGLKPPEAPPK